ncbi:hypothetical protein BDN70DRAFT_876259 [Pholiota conissans]|uniref:Uncharacterized protein n=1 Tax=Pholiota conissans TaxID=109636 RepID=A0A9P5Z792_9AGAR|nr:hypothetical protein BDN70DRAFT_876259 [Pholiota conissans]
MSTLVPSGSSSGATGPSTQTYETFNRDGRAQSEPLGSEEDVEMGEPIPFSRSETNLPLTTVDEYDEEEQTQPRAPSPVPTEVLQPDSQDVVAEIMSKGVKVRDFAYVQQPHHRKTSDPQSSTSVSLPTTSVPFKPATEIFDQYKGLAEVEFRWNQKTRKYPIEGRTLRRLLDMGWIKQEEVDRRAHPVDLEELALHDSRPTYPWRPFRVTSIPCMEQRKSLMNARFRMFTGLDAMREHTAQLAERIKEAEEKGEKLLANMVARMKSKGKARAQQPGGDRATSPSRNKRRLGDIGNDEATNDTANLLEVGSGSPKKRRLTPEVTPTQSNYFSHSQLGSQSQRFPSSSQPPLVAPEKQYPAPLHSYDPQIYPEAASIIEGSAASSSQPRPVVPQPVRGDTPPVEEEDERSPNRRRLMHPRAMRGGLVRTQTMELLV